WEMLDRNVSPWVLHVPGSITKNKRGRAIGLDGAVQAIIERRLAARRLDCPLIFHRTLKAKPGQVIYDIARVWAAALKAAALPAGRIFHDLRRSAVRNLIRAGVDPAVAMKVSGHKTRSMLDRYNIVEETETAAALVKARSEEHTSELQSLTNLVCRLLLEKKKTQSMIHVISAKSDTAASSSRSSFKQSTTQ